MKAVLEFTYPQDETKLKHALRGEEYYVSLVEIDRVLDMDEPYYQLLDRIGAILKEKLHDNGN